MFAPDSDRNASGQKFHTNMRAKHFSRVANSRANSPQNRWPLTSERVHAKPSIGRLGWTLQRASFGAAAALRRASRGCVTRPSIPRNPRTAAISPKGTPVCAMPNGPGFMPTKSASIPGRASARKRSCGSRAYTSGAYTCATGAAKRSRAMSRARRREIAASASAVPAQGDAAAAARRVASAPARGLASAPSRGAALAPSRGLASAPSRRAVLAPSRGAVLAPSRRDAVFLVVFVRFAAGMAAATLTAPISTWTGVRAVEGAALEMLYTG
jgi:hypothetical protein